MNIEEFLKEKSVEINNEISLFLPEKVSMKWVDSVAGKPEYAYDLDTINNSISKPVREFLSRGGKRWRPALLLLSCEAVGGKKENIKNFVVLPELVHNGTIIVDDVEDNSLFRRGKKTIHRIHGNDIAVNTGNMLYFLPLKIIDWYVEKNPEFKEKAFSIYDVYSDEMIRLSLGQAMDIYWHRGQAKNVSEEQYLQMCRYKTGSLACFSAKLGAILGNANKKQIEALGNFAASIGVAFQIQDDILNIAPSKDWGKELGDDINEGKRTLMVIRALKKLSKQKSTRLIKILDSHTEKQEEIKEAIELIKECSAVDYAKEKAREIVSNSWNKLECEIPESKAKTQLKSFADFLIERKI